MNVGNLNFTGMSCGGNTAKVMSAMASLSLAPRVDLNQKGGACRCTVGDSRPSLNRRFGNPSQT
jgi:hypothetical protein